MDRLIQALHPYRVSPLTYEIVGGVEIGLLPSTDGNSVHIMKIMTRVGLRDDGAASEAMQAVCAEADTHRVELFLDGEDHYLCSRETVFRMSTERI